ncbi:MAG: lysophospholipid acyltransferase family protein [Candidatus Theseobacter exili]|nr:lysophospholipid acyltransferase family protein [Candidatus Theseobacter exili]
MVRSILWFIYFWIILFCTILLFIPLFFLRLFSLKEYSERYVACITSVWARNIVVTTGTVVQVVGLENLPETNNICFVSNHQGQFDIPLIIGYIPKLVGFVAKKELIRVPIFNVWMKTINCIFIDRGHFRQSARVIIKGAESIRKGHPLVIFPEGTRSKGDKVGVFRKGSLQLATRSNALIIPLTISGTYRIWEETGRITPAKVSLTIHKPIDASELLDDDKKTIATRLREIICSALEKEKKES